MPPRHADRRGAGTSGLRGRRHREGDAPRADHAPGAEARQLAPARRAGLGERRARQQPGQPDAGHPVLDVELAVERLAPGGVLILDDYGTWQGAREAADEFLRETGEPLLLTRVARGAVAVKPGLQSTL